ncbi:rhomboid family protein [Asticcacaulis biprosthecium C19]|uniref:Rhomboid family protein n=1 Tax=Asticcacaulis biprosthecium C19 TaxID=715226 RepID=F4QR29_9CAUL|nr:rhomboid family intramembrane serine protease [Asticcacaulis biprosthecium]EGF90666.1 rhomboid family protein [Asticcacaulis biprosthecium C19]
MSDTAVPVTDQPESPEPQRISAGNLMFDPRNWPVWLVVVATGVVLAGQVAGVVTMEDWAFSSEAMREGRWWTLLTSMFLHGYTPEAPWLGYVHFASNMWAYLNLAPLVAARFGKGWRGVVPFHRLYVLCGLTGNLLFWQLHPQSDIPVVGASGAVYGVYAAVMRLDIFGEKVRPFLSYTTVNAVWFFIWSNALVILIFGGPYLLLQILQGQGGPLNIPIAWEAHLGGFVAGFILIGIIGGRQWPNGWRAGIQIIRAPILL